MTGTGAGTGTGTPPPSSSNTPGTEFALPNMTTSQAHQRDGSTNTSGNATAPAAGVTKDGESTSTNTLANLQLTYETANDARKLLAEHLIHLISSASTPVGSFELWDLLSNILPLPRLIYEFQHYKHRRWNLDGLLGTTSSSSLSNNMYGIITLPSTPSVSPAPSPISSPVSPCSSASTLDDLHAFVERVCRVDELKQDVELFQTILAPRCEEYVILHPTAPSAASSSSLKRSSHQSLFTLSSSSSNGSGSDGRTHDSIARRSTKEWTKEKERERRMSVNRPSSLAVPPAQGILGAINNMNNGTTVGAGGGNIASSTSSPAKLVQVPCHRHPCSTLTLVRSTYLLPSIELGRRYIHQQGHTIDSVVSVVALLTGTLLPTIQNTFRSVVTRGPLLPAMATTWRGEERDNSSFTIPMPWVNIGQELLSGMTEPLYDDLLSKVDRVFAQQMKWDGIPPSVLGGSVGGGVGGGGVSPSNPSEWEGGGDLSHRRNSKSFQWTGLGFGVGPHASLDGASLAPSPLPSPSARGWFNATATGNVAPMQILVPFTPPVGPFLAINNPMPLSSIDYIRQQEWACAKPSTLPPWTEAEAEIRYQHMNIRDATSSSSSSSPHPTWPPPLPSHLPRGWYARQDPSDPSSLATAPTCLLPLPQINADEEIPPCILHSAGKVIQVLGQLAPILIIPGLQCVIHEKLLLRLRTHVTKYLDNLARRLAAAPRTGSVRHMCLVASTIVGLKAHLQALEQLLVAGGMSYASVHLHQPIIATTGSNSATSSSDRPNLSPTDPPSIHSRVPSASPPRTPSTGPIVDRLGSLSGSLTALGPPASGSGSSSGGGSGSGAATVGMTRTRGSFSLSGANGSVSSPPASKRLAPLTTFGTIASMNASVNGSTSASNSATAPLIGAPRALTPSAASPILTSTASPILTSLNGGMGVSLQPLTPLMAPINGSDAAAISFSPSLPPVLQSQAPHLIPSNLTLRSFGLSPHANIVPLVDVMARLPTAPMIGAPHTQRGTSLGRDGMESIMNNSHHHHHQQSSGGHNHAVWSGNSPPAPYRRPSIMANTIMGGMYMMNSNATNDSASQLVSLRCSRTFYDLLDSLDTFLLRLIDAQLLDGILSSFSTMIAPNLTDGEWTRVRDLPPILMRPIQRPSASILHVKHFHIGLRADLFTLLPQVLARHVMTHATLHAALVCKETYLTLRPSRFHSRQFFVDLAALVVIFRSMAQGLEAHLKATSSGTSPSTHSLTSSTLIDHLNLICAELVIGVIINAPNLLTLEQLTQVVESWTKRLQQQAQQQQAQQSSASTPAPGSIAADLAPLSQHIARLWNCEPTVMKPPSGAAASPSSSTSHLGLLANLFHLPALGRRHPADPIVTNIGQDVDLECSNPMDLLLLPFVTHHLAPSQLMRLLELRHELRLADYPVLTEDQETQVETLRHAMQKLERIASGNKSA